MMLYTSSFPGLSYPVGWYHGVLLRCDESGESLEQLRARKQVSIRGRLRRAGNNPSYPPMGLRLRLKADFDITGFHPVNQKILRALKKYGVIIADTGADMFISGQHHDAWDDGVLHELQNVRAADFEALYTGEAIAYP